MSYVQHTATADPAENLRLLRDQWRSNASYRNYVAKLRSWDSKNQIAGLGGMANESDDHQKRRPRWASAIMTSALDMLSYLYAQAPVRVATNDKQWQRALWGFRYPQNLNSLMRGIDRSARRDGTVLGIAAPGNDEDPGADANGVDLQLRTRDLFEVLEHPKDPRVVGAALAWWGATESTSSTSSTDDELFRYVDGTVEGWATDAGAMFDTSTHDAGLCPAATYRNCYPDGLQAGLEPPLMGPPVGGQDIVEVLRTANKYVEQLIWAGILSRGQIVVSNKDQCVDLGIAPSNVMGVGEVGGAWSLNTGADLRGMIDVLQTQLILFSISMGRVWEIDTSRIAAAVNNTIPGAVKLSPIKGIAYTTSPQALTHSEKLAEARLKQEFALADRTRLLRELQPHLTDDEIEDSVKAGAEDAQFFSDLTAKRAGHLEDTREDGRNANEKTAPSGVELARNMAEEFDE
ncbi:MAG: hypothetical protein ACYTBJ_16290 [Planctomycetota bacterium]|jgi:hypothetical protein